MNKKLNLTESNVDKYYYIAEGIRRYNNCKINYSVICKLIRVLEFESAEVLYSTYKIEVIHCLKNISRPLRILEIVNCDVYGHEVTHKNVELFRLLYS